MDHYDVIVVGAGSSGGVVAARLSENAARKVLLLEAGPDFPLEETIPPLFTFSGEHHWRGAAGIPEFDWDFVNTDGAGALRGRSLRVPRGRLVGGTSMINATIAALRMGGLVLAIVLVALLMFVLKPRSFNIDVGISVLRAMSSLAIMALGLTLVIVVGEIDLSFGAMYGLGANSLAVLWILLGIPIYAALPLAIGIGALVGLFNGALVTWLRIPSFIVTLGTYNLLYGVSLWITKTSTFNPVYPPPGSDIPPAELDFFTGLTASFGAHPISLEVVWMLGLALVIGFLLHRTLFGFRLMAIGGNPVAAQLARLPVTRYKIIAFVICSMLAAVAGILDFSFIQTTQPNIGLSYTFPVFAAVIIGGASLSGGKGTVIGAMSGALLLAELQQGLALLSPGPHVQQLFLGFVTIGAVALDLALTNIRKRRAA